MTDPIFHWGRTNPAANIINPVVRDKIKQRRRRRVPELYGADLWGGDIITTGTETALAQIDTKEYAFPWTGSGKKVFKVGVSFDFEKRGIREWVATTDDETFFHDNRLYVNFLIIASVIFNESKSLSL